MAAEKVEIQGMSKMQPLFREYCKINNLDDGCLYRAIDYIFWVDKLSIKEQFEIIRKYTPEFKLKGCNL